MRTIFFSLLFLYTACSFAQVSDHRVIIPGVKYSRMSLPGPFTVNIVEFDLKNPVLHLETYWKGFLTATSVQAAANDSDGHRVIAAVNGDLFLNNGWPTDNAVIAGKTILAKQSYRSHLALSQNYKPSIEQFSFSGKCITDSGYSLVISGVNTSRISGTAILFNSFFGNSTSTDGSGIECSLAPLFTTWSTNDTLAFVVQEKQTAGNMTIPPDGVILSAGSGTPASFVANKLSVGDTVKLYIGFTPNSAQKILHLLGGAGRLVKNGKNVGVSMAHSEGLLQSFYTTRYARTFAGFNADTSTFYLCTVDLSDSSLGMTFDEMANFLLSIGVSDAFNLDGGPSTTMVVNDTVVSNTGTGFERSVANTLQLICTAQSGTLAFLSLNEKDVKIIQGDTLQFNLTGTDYYLNPVSALPVLQWSADSSIGGIDANGKFIAGNSIDSGWVRVRYNEVRDSAKIIVTEKPAGVDDKSGQAVEKFSLEQNFPNPFNPSTEFRYHLPGNSFVSMKIFDVLGREVATLVNELQQAGSHSVQWYAGAMSSGMYICRLISFDKNGSTYSGTKRLTLVK